MRPKLSCELKSDSVLRQIRDLTAEEMVDWLIEFKGLEKSGRDNVISNLNEQFKWHRLNGRLDRSNFWTVIALLLKVKLFFYY